jgi:hypothetical protein
MKNHRPPYTPAPRRTFIAKPAPSPHRAMPPRPPVHEPAEREDPLNAALDAAEQLVTNIIASGGEGPLRARLARLLPTDSAGGGL